MIHGDREGRRSEGEFLGGDQTRRVLGAAIEVHRALGPGFVESVYEHALCVELGLRGIAYRRQVPVEVVYKQERVGRAFIDLIVAGTVVVELKAVEAILPVHIGQLRSYLVATQLQLGLLINFDVDFLRKGVRRLIHTPPSDLRPSHPP